MIQRWQRRTLIVALALIALVLPVAVASAHADLIGAEPADGEVLTQSPTRVRLFFSEPIEREFFALEVYTQDRVRVDRQDAAIPADNVAALEANLQPLTSGTYTVVWRVLSIDGHVVRGAYAFSVGQAAPGTTPVLDIAASGTPMALGATVRWWTYLAVFVLVGGLAFGPLVLTPALGAAGITAPGAAEHGTRRWVWVAWPSIVLLFGLSLMALAVQAADATGVPLAEVFSGRAITRLLTGTKYGTLWLTRMGLLLGLLAVVVAVTAQTHTRRWLSWLGLALGGGFLLTIAAAGHASAVPEQTLLAIGADWLHLVAGAVWIGGLVQLVLALPAVLKPLELSARRTLLAQAVRRFSMLATLSVAALVVTGLYAGWLHVPTWQALLDTVYGATLSGKLILVVPLLLLGAINLLVLHPRFRRAAAASAKQVDDTRGQRTFQRIVRGEIILVVLVLATTGLLAGLAPATTEPMASVPFQATQPLGALNAQLNVTPNEVGTNQIELRLIDQAGQPVTAERVTLMMHHLEMDMGQREVQAEPVDGGSYRARGNFLSMAGTWQTDVRVQVAGQAVQTTAFQFTVGKAPGINQPLFSPARVLWQALTPLTIIGLGAFSVALLIFTQRGSFPNRRSRREAGLIGLVLLIVGVWGTTVGVGNAYRASQPQRVASTAASIARGNELYTQNCVMCHGVAGRGDGPAAITMNPRPANLEAHLAKGHTDEELYDWVANGITGTRMPAFKDTLTEEEIWHVINKIRTFGPQVTTR